MKKNLSPIEKEIRQRTRRSFLVALTSLTAGLLGWHWLRTSPEDDGIPWPLRKVLEFNGAIWGKSYSSKRDETIPPAPPAGKKARVNGDIGITTPINPATWKMNVISGTRFPQNSPYVLTMADLKKMPKSESVADFKCIEGWSEVMSYGGVRFSDFVHHLGHLGIATRSGRSPDILNSQEDLFRYIGLETPDQGYYVSLDMESMLHPRTILAYELNGVPLSDEHGAPLRLIIPVKYGIKSLKRIGTIAFGDERQPDYWAEQGYDWFSGL